MKSGTKRFSRGWCWLSQNATCMMLRRLFRVRETIDVCARDANNTIMILENCNRMLFIQFSDGWIYLVVFSVILTPWSVNRNSKARFRAPRVPVQSLAAFLFHYLIKASQLFTIDGFILTFHHHHWIKRDLTSHENHNNCLQKLILRSKKYMF